MDKKVNDIKRYFFRCWQILSMPNLEKKDVNRMRKFLCFITQPVFDKALKKKFFRIYERQ